MSGLSENELRATLYFAVGVTSESKYEAYKLSVAGDLASTPTLEVADNSGYTIGTLQTDLGQHYQPDDPRGENVPRDLVMAYQSWAGADQARHVLTDQEVAQTVADLGRNGRAIKADGGRPVDATVKGQLDEFLASNEGISWVHARDVSQVNKVMDQAIAPLQRSDVYTGASLDDQAKLAAMVGKVFNQNEAAANRMISRIEANEYSSVAEVSTAIDNLSPKRTGRGDYFEMGRDDALRGVAVINALRNAGEANPLSSVWSDVVANPLVNPTELTADTLRPNMQSQYPVIKNLFLHDNVADRFVSELERGGAYANAQTDRTPGQNFNGAGFYVSGNDFITWSKNGDGHGQIGGAWNEFSRDDIIRVQSGNGVTDLNITTGGATRRLLRVDENAPDLRPESTQQDVPTGPAQTHHQDHALLNQIRSGVEKMEKDRGMVADDSSERLCRSLLAACKDNSAQYPGMQSMSANEIKRVDHVVVGGGNVFVVQGALGDPASLRAHVPEQQGRDASNEQSDAKLLAANQSISQEQQIRQPVNLTQDQSSGPRMAM